MNTAKKQPLKLPGFPDVEYDLLAACLCVNDVGPRIVLGSLVKEDFSDWKMAEIFEAMKAIVSRGEDFDVPSLIAELELRKQVEVIGGVPFLYEMVKGLILTPSWTFEHHCKVIKQAATARRIVLACHSVVNDFEEISASSDGWGGFSERVRAKINQIADDRPDEGFASSAEVAKEALEEIKAAKESSRNGLIGITTGLLGLDAMTHGWQPGQLIVIAGKSSMGKSALAVHSAYSAAKAGNEIAYFSLEMSNASNMKRILSNESGVVTDKMVGGFASKDEMARLEKAAESVGAAPMHFTDRLSGYEEITAAITRLKARRPGLKAVFIDYLQLMSTNQKGLSRDREIGIQTGGLKRLASKLGIAIVLLSQVNRGTAGTEAPTMDNLRESGNIEQDANVVIFVHRSDYFDRGKPQERMSNADIILAKNREGKTGTIQVAFDKAISRFADIAA